MLNFCWLKYLRSPFYSTSISTDSTKHQCNVVNQYLNTILRFFHLPFFLNFTFQNQDFQLKILQVNCLEINEIKCFFSVYQISINVFEFVYASQLKIGDASLLTLGHWLDISFCSQLSQYVNGVILSKPQVSHLASPTFFTVQIQSFWEPVLTSKLVLSST